MPRFSTTAILLKGLLTASEMVIKAQAIPGYMCLNVDKQSIVISQEGDVEKLADDMINSINDSPGNHTAKISHEISECPFPGKPRVKTFSDANLFTYGCTMGVFEYQHRPEIAWNAMKEFCQMTLNTGVVAGFSVGVFLLGVGAATYCIIKRRQAEANIEGEPDDDLHVSIQGNNYPKGYGAVNGSEFSDEGNPPLQQQASHSP